MISSANRRRELTVKKIAVIGAGIWEVGLQLKLPNAGNNVLLLDLPAEGDGEQSPARVLLRG